MWSFLDSLAFLFHLAGDHWATIVFFYAGMGGMKGITYTQVAQYMVIVFAYTLPALFISFALTGHVLPQVGSK